jgi:hypothetical protein
MSKEFLNLTGRAVSVNAADHFEPMAVHIHDLYIEIDEKNRQFFNLIRWIAQSTYPGPSK